MVKKKVQFLERLYRLGLNRPFVQTPQGLKYLNDANVTCCHSSATRTSALHPLICEYQHYKQILSFTSDSNYFVCFYLQFFRIFSDLCGKIEGFG